MNRAEPEKERTLRKRAAPERRPFENHAGPRGGIAGRERGVALVLALVMLVLLGLLGALSLSTSSTELRITGNYRTSQAGFFAAEAAQEYASANPAIYDIATAPLTAIPRGADRLWPAPTAGTSTRDSNFNNLTVGSNAADVRVEWLACGELPRGIGMEVDPAIGAAALARANYYLVDVAGVTAGANAARMPVEVQVARVVARCP